MDKYLNEKGTAELLTNISTYVAKKLVAYADLEPLVLTASATQNSEVTGATWQEFLAALESGRQMIFVDSDTNIQYRLTYAEGGTSSGGGMAYFETSDGAIGKLNQVTVLNDGTDSFYVDVCSEKKIPDATTVVQATGTSTTSVMSQNAVTTALADKEPKKYVVNITKKSGKYAVDRTPAEFLAAVSAGKDIVVQYYGEGNARLADQWDDMYEFVVVETEDPDDTDPTKVDGLGMVCTIFDLFVDSSASAITVRIRWPRPLTQQKSIVQATGTSTTTIMSQNAVTTELAKKANTADLVRYRLVPVFNPVPVDMQGTVCSELFHVYAQAANGIMTQMSATDLKGTEMYFRLTNTDADDGKYFFADGDYEAACISCYSHNATIELYDGNDNLLDILVMAMNTE